MRFSLTSLIRAVLLFGSVTTCVALGLASVAGPPMQARRAGHVGYVNLNTSLLYQERKASTWLDPTTGRVKALELPDGEELELASLSPWLDETGEPQAVGRWTRRVGPRVDMTKGQFGLARVRFPSGKVVQTISTEILPVGVPCWFAAPKAHILFGAGDGKLYTLDLDAAGEESRPREVRWAIPKPGVGEVYLADPSWIDGEFGASRRLAVMLRMMEKNAEGKTRFVNSRIWWLRLGPDGEAIVAGGPLTPAPTAPEQYDVRFPVTHRTPEGRILLGYVRAGVPRGNQLAVTELDTPEGGDGPLVARRAGRVVVDPCLPSPPAFSADGRAVTTMKGVMFRNRELVRISLAPEREGLAAAEQASAVR